MKQPLRNSDLGLKFLEQRQRGKIPTEFGVNAQVKAVKRTYVDINKDDVAIYEGICKSSNVSISALFEFMMAEAILRANGDILAHKHKGKLRPLFTNKVQGSGFEDFEAKRQELSNCIVKLQQVTLDELDREAKLERMEQALFISDGLIPNSFKKKFR